MNECFSLDQVVEMLIPSRFPLFLIDCCLDHVPQLSAVKESTRVFKNVLRAVVQYFAHEESQKRVDLWVLSEILFILDS